MEFRLLGPFEVVDQGRTLALGGRKQRAVLAMLALEAGRVVSRDRLIDGVWGDAATDTAVATLQVYVSTLRRVIPGGEHGASLVGRRPGYLLEVDPEQVDALRFERLVTEARKELADQRHEAAATGFQTALDLWRGPPLADLAADDFAAPEVARLVELRTGAIEDRIQADLACGRHMAVVPELETLVLEHPFRERLWGHLMVALYRSGLQSEALVAFARARSTLVEEFGIDPGPELRELERQVLSQDPGLAAPHGAPRTTVKLPAPAHQLVGRVDEVTAVAAQLGSGARLVTLTGPGGTGKTSLALEVAAQLVDGFPGGLYFVALAGVSDPDQVLATVADALEVSPAPDEPLVQSVSVSLGAQPVLLVLDNLEQVLASAGVLVDLLGRTPSLTILATSRAPLHVRGEREHPVPALTMPPASTGRAARADEARSSPAVQLFVARAGEARPGFVLDDANAQAVSDVCRRLDGLPLALELAAARISVLDPQALLDRLDRQLAVLTSGARDLPDRQRTLRATLDWSYSLLTVDQQRLLARLGAVAGEVSVGTAEALAGDLDALTGLGALAENGLLRRTERADGTWFRMLGAVREYASELLAGSGEEATVRSALARQLVDGLELIEPGFEGPQAPALLTRVEADYPDLRASLEWCIGPGEDARTAARIAIGLRLFWLIGGRLAEGRSWVRRILAAPGIDDASRGRLQLAAGMFAYFQDDREDARASLTAALAAAKESKDVASEGATLSYLGALVLGDGDGERALALAARALELAELHDLYEVRVLALSLSAVVAASRDELSTERALYLRRLELARGRGDVRRIAETLNNLAELSLAEGDVTAARRFAADALELARSVARIVTRDVLLTRGRVAAADGDLQLAGASVGQALHLSVELGQEFELGQCLMALAGVAASTGDHERAARLFGAAGRLRGSSGPLDVDLEPDLAQARERTRQALGPEAFEGAQAAGAALDRDAATAFALSEASSWPQQPARQPMR